MPGVLQKTFIGGEVKTDITSITLVNNTAKEVLHTVPTGKIHLIKFFRIANPDDVQRTILAYIYNEAAKTNVVRQLYSETMNANVVYQWPNVAATLTLQKRSFGAGVYLTAGQTIRFNWASGGASTGGTDTDGLVVCYIEVDA